jgi:photosystem II stability/assembly factor-like uncharacterized protein
VLGATWTKLENAPKLARGKQDDIFFTSPLRGFAVNGQNSTIHRTEDGGQTWKTVFSHPGTYFRAILFTDEKHGFAGNLGAGLSGAITDATVLYETKDGGDTWAPVTTITGATPKGICNLTAVDAQHIIGVGRANGPSHMIVSNDGGESWTATDITTELSMLIDARFTSPTEGIIAGQNAGTPAVCTILRTTDGGKSFTKVFASGTANSLCWKLSFPSEKVGYASIQDSVSGPATLAKTTDGGQTWAELPLPLAANAKAGFAAVGVGFITEDIGWISSESDTKPSYRTVDGGQTWEQDPALGPAINRFRFVDKKTAYAIGGSVWKLDIPWKTP